MSITIATGTQVAVASVYATQFNITAITNANPAVATASVGHGVTVGDIIHIKSGWDLINDRVFRVSVVSTNDLTLEGLNTVNTDNYPAGAGTGTAREISTWTPITQIQGISSSGGEPNFADISTIADRTQKQLPTTRSATNLTFTVFDDPSLAGFIAAAAAADALVPTALRIIFPGGSRMLNSGYFSVQKTPAVAINAPLTADITFAAAAEPTRYAT